VPPESADGRRSLLNLCEIRGRGYADLHLTSSQQSNGGDSYGAPRSHYRPLAASLRRVPDSTRLPGGMSLGFRRVFLPLGSLTRFEPRPTAPPGLTTSPQAIPAVLSTYPAQACAVPCGSSRVATLRFEYNMFSTPRALEPGLQAGACRAQSRSPDAATMTKAQAVELKKRLGVHYPR
jgi:hypothetical protein